MAHAISAASTVNHQTPSTAAAASAQSGDNSIFSLLLSQLQGSSEEATLSPGLGDLLGKDKAMAEPSAAGDTSAFAQAVQLLMPGYQPLHGLPGSNGRQQLPESAGFAGQPLPSQAITALLASQAQHSEVISQRLAQADAAGVGEAAAFDVSQLLPGTDDTEPAQLDTQATVAGLVEAGKGSARRGGVLPDDVRLMFRAEAAAADDELQQAVPQLDDTHAANLAAASLSTAGASQALNHELSQPMARGSQAWRHEFAEKLGQMVQFKLDSASIKVTPEHLGPLDISISFDSQNKAQINVVAANHAAREIVESSLPQLGRMLEQSGIQLGNVEVSSQQQFAQQQAQHWQHGQQRGQQQRTPADETQARGDETVAALGAAELQPETVAASDQLSIRA